MVTGRLPTDRHGNPRVLEPVRKSSIDAFPSFNAVIIIDTDNEMKAIYDFCAIRFLCFYIYFGFILYGRRSDASLAFRPAAAYAWHRKRNRPGDCFPGDSQIPR